MPDTNVTMIDQTTVTVRDELNHSQIGKELAEKGFYTTTRLYMGREGEITLMKAGVIFLTPN